MFRYVFRRYFLRGNTYVRMHADEQRMGIDLRGGNALPVVEFMQSRAAQVGEANSSKIGAQARDRRAYLLRRSAANMIAGGNRSFQGQHGEDVRVNQL